MPAILRAQTRTPASSGVRKSILPHKPQIINIPEYARAFAYARNSTGGKCGAPKLRLPPRVVALERTYFIACAHSRSFSDAFFLPCHIRIHFFFFFFFLSFYSRLLLIRAHARYFANRYSLRDMISSRAIYIMSRRINIFMKELQKPGTLQKVIFACAKYIHLRTLHFYSSLLVRFYIFIR